MRNVILALFATTALMASPAAAQDRRQAPSNGSSLAQQALATGDQPEVLLDVPDLSVEEITPEVDKVDVHIVLDARPANLLKLTAGADASIDKVKLSIKGVHAQATLIVQLANVRTIIERTLQTLGNSPNIINGQYSTVDNALGNVGGVTNSTLGTVGGVANNALDTVGGITSNLLRNG